MKCSWSTMLSKMRSCQLSSAESDAKKLVSANTLPQVKEYRELFENKKISKS